jgi:hypothetical protein
MSSYAVPPFLQYENIITGNLVFSKSLISIIQVSVADIELLKIITIYEPHENEWIKLFETEVIMFYCHVCGSKEVKGKFVNEVF